MKKIFISILASVLAAAFLSFTCMANAREADVSEGAALQDGVYLAVFETDSSMFRVNEANEDKGVLTVLNGEMTIHISLASKKILNLFPGLAEDAEKEGAELLEPSIDEITYSDGYTENVHGFDVPVPYLDDEFDLALIGTKGKWYDHKVSVHDPSPLAKTVSGLGLSDGVYSVDVSMEGGSGRASIQSPAELRIRDGKAEAVIIWSSDKYDYMLVKGERYDPVTTEGGSTFEIPVDYFGYGIDVVGDTTAMSTPHEVEYVFTFDPDSIESK